jgi:hypothetical protein
MACIVVGEVTWLRTGLQWQGHLVNASADAKCMQGHICLLVDQPFHHTSGLHARPHICRTEHQPTLLMMQQSQGHDGRLPACQTLQATMSRTKAPRVPGMRPHGRLSAAPAPAHGGNRIIEGVCKRECMPGELPCIRVRTL